MKIIATLTAAMLTIATALSAQTTQTTVVINTDAGTMKAILYPDTPNHLKAFVEKAQKGAYNGTLFTRVIKDFMIHGGSADSKNAKAGARVGIGDPASEILPEFLPNHFHKKGALCAPRRPDEVNPEKKSDMSQFYIAQGKVYTEEELDALESQHNLAARTAACRPGTPALLPTAYSIELHPTIQILFLGLPTPHLWTNRQIDGEAEISKYDQQHPCRRRKHYLRAISAIVEWEDRSWRDY